MQIILEYMAQGGYNKNVDEARFFLKISLQISISYGLPLGKHFLVENEGIWEKMRKAGKKMKIVVSACLLGENCKYNGGNNFRESVARFAEGREVIPVCPEMLAGLGTPRVPIEIKNGIVTSQSGEVVDGKIREAVARILADLSKEEIQCAVLKARSPTCGVKQVYDGSFSGTLINGAGVLAQALMENGYLVIEDEDL